MRRYRQAALGGTFDGLHPGHLRLLAAAFDRAEAVRIGLTTAAYLRAHPKPYADLIASYPARRAALVRFLATTYPGRDVRVVPLRDGLGGAVRPGPDLLVVSDESRPGAEAVNRVRRERELPELRIVAVRTVRDASGRPFASRRRRAGEARRRRVAAANA